MDLEKRDNTQINKIGNESGDITTNPTERKDYKRVLWAIVYQQIE